MGNAGTGAMIGGAVQQVASSIIGPIVAMKQQERAQAEAEDLYKKYYDQATQYYQPYAQNAAQDYNRFRQNTLTGKYDNPEYNFQYQEQAPKFNFQQDPGYQFRMKEGANAVENSAAARGTQLSGATLKALQRYGQNFASNEYGQAFNRYLSDYTNWQNNRNFAAGQYNTAYSQNAANRENQYNRMANLANTGYQANQTLGNMTNQYGQDLANLRINTGNMRSAAALAAMTANQSMGNQAVTMGSMANNYQSGGK